MTNDVDGDCRSLVKERERIMYSKEIRETDERVSFVYKAWSDLLSKSTDMEHQFSQTTGLSKLNVPEAPHLDNCKLRAELNQRFDTRLPNRSFPPWTIWKGMLDDLPLLAIDEELKQYRDHIISEGAYPPWVCSLT